MILVKARFGGQIGTKRVGKTLASWLVLCWMSSELAALRVAFLG